MQSIILEIINIWGSYFCSKYCKFYVNYGNAEKIEKIFFDFELFPFELVALDTLFYWETIHFTGCQYVNKQSQDFRYYQNRIFRADYLSEWPEKLTKIRLCRFKQCFVPFNMLAFLKCSDTGLCRHLSNPAFCSL